MDVPGATEGALAQPTRARIFSFLVEKRAPADTAEIAAAFGLHPNGIRAHLERLEEGGFVVRSARQPKGAGRPRDIWTVSPRAHPGGPSPRAYGDLAGWLARAIPPNRSRVREVERTGREIGAELVGEPGEDPEAAFRDALAALGFEPELRRRRDGFQCRLSNCPYSGAVHRNQPIVCGLHRGITAGILAALDPGAKLTEFEPHDPDRAGCLVEVRRP
ncbi:MAG TPA: helix-turn-helix domain-containing protein [Solirubrobacterales bacterium]|nr:helix-turn-helix domain-containing protein [Solirubrobacterales bacterium]